jgi:hypothetical protein
VHQTVEKTLQCIQLDQLISRPHVANRDIACPGDSKIILVTGGSVARRHSSNFFEIVDQPIKIMMADTEQQAMALFEKLQNHRDTLVLHQSTDRIR